MRVIVVLIACGTLALPWSIGREATAKESKSCTGREDSDDYKLESGIKFLIPKGWRYTVKGFDWEDNKNSNSFHASDQLRKYMNKLTVKIIGPGSPGSGVLVSKTDEIYTILTAAHVVENALPEEVEIRTNDGKQFQVSSIKVYSPIDLAEVKIKTRNCMPTATFANIHCGAASLMSTGSALCNRPAVSGKMLRADRVMISGFPISDLNIKHSPAIVSIQSIWPSARASGYTLEYWPLHKDGTTEGMSGGPIFNKYGDVLGIHGQSDGYYLGNKFIRRGSRYGISSSIYRDILLRGLDKLLAKNRSQSRSIDFELVGSYQISSGKYKEAVESLSKAIDHALYELIEQDRKTREWDSVLDKADKPPSGYESLDMRDFLNKRRDKVTSDLNQRGAIAESYSKEIIDLYQLRGNAYMLLGDSRKADVDFEKCKYLVSLGNISSANSCEYEFNSVE